MCIHFEEICNLSTINKLEMDNEKYTKFNIPGVYLWIINIGQSFKAIAYVGRAYYNGKTIIDRNITHFSNFKYESVLFDTTKYIEKGLRLQKCYCTRHESYWNPEIIKRQIQENYIHKGKIPHNLDEKKFDKLIEENRKIYTLYGAIENNITRENYVVGKLERYIIETLYRNNLDICCTNHPAKWLQNQTHIKVSSYPELHKQFHNKIEFSHELKGKLLGENLFK